MSNQGPVRNVDDIERLLCDQHPSQETICHYPISFEPLFERTPANLGYISNPLYSSIVVNSWFSPPEYMDISLKRLYIRHSVEMDWKSHQVESYRGVDNPPHYEVGIYHDVDDQGDVIGDGSAKWYPDDIVDADDVVGEDGDGRPEASREEWFFR